VSVSAARSRCLINFARQFGATAFAGLATDLRICLVIPFPRVALKGPAAPPSQRSATDA